ncbi:MAG TPA: hypothetical protein VHE55_17055 [Fimbriimonadaceae bacterium]|nr:hypothetical protein [Fimbriimonadaceae bacterium]
MILATWSVACPAATLVSSSASSDAVGPTMAMFTSTESTPRTIIRVAFVDGVSGGTSSPGTDIHIRDYDGSMNYLGEHTVLLSGTDSSKRRYTMPNLSRDGLGIVFYGTTNTSYPLPTNVFFASLSSTPYTSSGTVTASSPSYEGAGPVGTLGQSTTLFSNVYARPPAISNKDSNGGFLIVWPDLYAESVGSGGTGGSGGAGLLFRSQRNSSLSFMYPTSAPASNDAVLPAPGDPLARLQGTPYTPLMYWDTYSGGNADISGTNNWTEPAVSSDKSVLAFAYQSQIYRATGGRSSWSSNTSVISQYGGSNGNAASQWPEIDGDGGTIVFSTDATNLRSSDTNSMRDIYYWTSSTGVVLAYNDPGEWAGSSCDYPTISPSGEAMAFQSSNKGFLSSTVNYSNRLGPFVYYVTVGTPSDLKLWSYSSSSSTDARNATSPCIADTKNMVFQTCDTGLASGDTRSGIDVIYN